ncbi:MAG: xanthine dehydrogenase accessory protein XdhC, partial [Pseudobdellovibrionaceae bacterium]
TKGSTPREVGAKMLVTKKEFFGTIGGGALEWMALEKARSLLKADESQKLAVPLCSKAHQCCGGFVELFFDVIRPRPQVLIFGAGHVSQALLEVLAGTAFECSVIDERPEWIEAAQRKKVQLTNLSLQTVNQPILDWIDTQKTNWGSSTYAVVMTHDHALDEAIIEKLSPLSLRYLGLIGSRTKRLRFFSRLEEKGLPLQQLQQIRCPMGIPLKSKIPKDVALSIGIELLQTHFYQEESIFKTLPEASAEPKSLDL